MLRLTVKNTDALPGERSGCGRGFHPIDLLLVATEDGQAEIFNYSKWTQCCRAVSLKGMTGELAQLKKKIGSRIRQRREDARMSQEALAFEADLTPSYLCQIEAGKRNPSIGALYRLCSALRLDLSDLVKV